VKLKMPAPSPRQTLSIPWALQMKAVSIEEPSRLVQLLTGAILGCGGWVLSRGANDSGRVNMLFEFERQACVDIYTILVAAGVELSQTGHPIDRTLPVHTQPAKGLRRGDRERRSGDSDLPPGDCRCHAVVWACLRLPSLSRRRARAVPQLM